MSGYHRLTYHFVWCPMRCKPCLQGEAAQRLAELIEQKLRELEVELHECRILPDRVYIGISAPPTMAPHRIACQVKSYTSRVLRQEFVEMTRIPTLWTRTYLVFGGEQVNAEEAMARFDELQPSRRPRGRPRKMRRE